MEKVMEKIQKINAVLGIIEKYLLAFIVAVMALLLGYCVFSRVVINKSFQYQEELGITLMIAISYFGSITAVRKSKHIRMVFLSEKMGFKSSYVLTVFNAALTAVCFFYIGIMCTQYMGTVIQSHRMFQTIQLPRWIIWLPVVIGLFGTSLQYVLVVLYNIIDHKNMKSKDDIWIGSDRKNSESEY